MSSRQTWAARAFALAALLAGAVSADAQVSKRPPIKAATPCELAWRIFFGGTGLNAPGPMVYDAQPFLRHPATASQETPRRDIPADLLRSWEAAPPGNLLVACPKLKPRLPATVTFATDQQREAVKRIRNDGTYLIQIGPPVVSKSGDDLLIEQRGLCPGWCGSNGVVLHFRRTRAGWQELQPLLMWIS